VEKLIKETRFISRGEEPVRWSGHLSISFSYNTNLSGSIVFQNEFLFISKELVVRKKYLPDFIIFFLMVNNDFKG